MDWAQIAPGVIVAALGFGGAFLTTWIQNKGRPENLLIDQLQEELARHATRIGGLESEQGKAKKRERIRDDYINKLRRHIEAGSPPPPPEWPEGLYD
jgi:sugar phosphate isomerase/epimerase